MFLLKKVDYDNSALLLSERARFYVLDTEDGVTEVISAKSLYEYISGGIEIGNIVIDENNRGLVFQFSDDVEIAMELLGTHNLGEGLFGSIVFSKEGTGTVRISGGASEAIAEELVSGDISLENESESLNSEISEDVESDYVKESADNTVDDTEYKDNMEDDSERVTSYCANSSDNIANFSEQTFNKLDDTLDSEEFDDDTLDSEVLVDSFDSEEFDDDSFDSEEFDDDTLDSEAFDDDSLDDETLNDDFDDETLNDDFDDETLNDDFDDETLNVDFDINNLTLKCCIKALSVVLDIEIVGDYNESLDSSGEYFRLKSTSSDFTYFLGDHIAICLDSKYAYDNESKNEVLRLFNNTPFKSNDGMRIKLIDECWGTTNILERYAPFSKELTPNDKTAGFIRINVKGFPFK